MRRVLVTGATGFLGRALLPMLLDHGWHVRAAIRESRPGLEPRPGLEVAAVGDLSRTPAWEPALAGVDAVIHLAARVHVMRDRAADPLAAFRAVNRDATRALARAAVEAGVSRLVFVSSIKALGEGGPACLEDGTPPRPDSPYGQSKLEGEEALAAETAGTPTSWCVLRPPLVYGPEVRGNFLSLLRWCRRGLPLPLGAVKNQRSLIFVGNLAHAILHTLTHPAATGRRFLLHDGPPLSTPALIRELAARLHRPARLIPVPPEWLAAGARLVGAGAVWERLGGSLTVDDTPLRRECGWQPPWTTAQGLDVTAAWFESSMTRALPWTRQGPQAPEPH